MIPPLFDLEPQSRELLLAGRRASPSEAADVLVRLLRRAIDAELCGSRKSWLEIAQSLESNYLGDAQNQFRSMREGSRYGCGDEYKLERLFHAVIDCKRISSSFPHAAVNAAEDVAGLIRQRSGENCNEPDPQFVLRLLYDMAGVPIPPEPPAPLPPPTLTKSHAAKLRALSARDTARLAHATAVSAAKSLGPGVAKIACEHLAGAIATFLRTGGSRDDRAALVAARDHFDQIRGRARTPWPESYDAPWWAVEALVNGDSDGTTLTHAMMSAVTLATDADAKLSYRAAADALFAALATPEPPKEDPVPPAPEEKPVPQIFLNPSVADDTLAGLLRIVRDGADHGLQSTVIGQVCGAEPALDDRKMHATFVDAACRILRVMPGMDTPPIRMALEETEHRLRDARTGNAPPLFDDPRLPDVVALTRSSVVHQQPAIIARMMLALARELRNLRGDEAHRALLVAGCTESADVIEEIAALDARELALATAEASREEPATATGARLVGHVSDAAVRIGVRQAVLAIRDPLAALLARPMGLADETRADMAALLQTPGGEAITSALLSIVPSVVAPGVPLAERVADEFRVRTLVAIGEPVLELFAEPLRAYFDTVMAAFAPEADAPSVGPAPALAASEPAGPPLRVPPPQAPEKMSARASRPRRGRA